jgi:predicted permease
MLQDVRFALRQFRHAPGFALLAVITFALGVGANAAVFSVMNAVVLRYLPVADPGRLVFLHTSRQPSNSSQTGFDDTSLSYSVFEALRAEPRIFSELVAFVPLGTGQTPVRYGADAETVSADMVSGNFFSGLGVRLAQGRGFTLDDERQQAAVVVISDGYWTRRFGRSPSAIGQTLYVKGVPFTIVGITGSEFAGVDHGRSTDIWIPAQDRPELRPWGRPPESSDTYSHSPAWWFLLTIGRLAPGVSADEALARAQPIFQHAAYSTRGGTPPKGETPPKIFFSDARGIQGLSGQYREPLAILMGMVAVVLIIACGNVAMLLAARNAARQREFSLRAALGGSQARLFRQLLIESLLLVSSGTALAWLFAIWATKALAAWSDLEVTLAPDLNVLAYTLALSLVSALLFGLAPLRAVRNTPIGLVLRSTALNATTDRTRLRGARMILAAQIALSVALLVGAGLLVRTLANLNGADLGLRASGLFVFGVAPPQSIRGDEATVQFHQRLLERVRQLPGVETATLMSNRIGSGWSNNTGAIVDGKKPEPGKFSPMRWNGVGADYFRTLQIPLVLGRDFRDTDMLGGPPVAVINETYVRQYFKGQPPIGHTVAIGDGPGATQFTVVGVAADSRYTSVRESSRAMAYFPYGKLRGEGEMHFEVRTSGDPLALLPQVRKIVQEYGPDLPLLKPMTQQQQFAASFRDEQLFSRLASAFGLLAAILVASGLYGSLSYRVSRRTAEIGIRVALGARRGQVVWLVLGEGLRICAIGLAIGVPLAIGAARLLRARLFGLTPDDPLSFGLAIAGITLVTIAAALLPARRALSVDPMLALRSD